jgi:hypothetical protein
MHSAIRQYLGYSSNCVKSSCLLCIGADDFKAHFQEFGPVTEAQIMVDYNSGRSRGFGCDRGYFFVCTCVHPVLAFFYYVLWGSVFVF